MSSEQQDQAEWVKCDRTGVSLYGLLYIDSDYRMRSDTHVGRVSFSVGGFYRQGEAVVSNHLKKGDVSEFTGVMHCGGMRYLRFKLEMERRARGVPWECKMHVMHIPADQALLEVTA